MFTIAKIVALTFTLFVFITISFYFITNFGIDIKQDNDNDGFFSIISGGDDCDDDNPDINPSATEKCDKVDNNCDGVIDINQDNDNDGFYYCDDCDDDNPDINPSATEKCDKVDNNCDGVIDDLNCYCINSETKPCGSNIGICKEGIMTCDNGNWGICIGDIKAEKEICGDGIDQDCDNEDLKCPSGGGGSGGGGGGGSGGGGEDPPPSQVCGNNIIEGDEECDDGNTISGDGCDSQCKIEIETLTSDTSEIPNSYVGVYYEAEINVTGGVPPYTWELIGSIPNGLEFNEGLISGIPEQVEINNFYIKVIDSDGNEIELPLEIEVIPAGGTVTNSFVPDLFAPLSTFISLETGGEKYGAILPVIPEILSFISDVGASPKVSCNLDGTISYFDPSFVDVENGVVVLEVSENQVCVVVCDTENGIFENDFPIATNWNAQLNDGRGGFEAGASDEVPPLRNTDTEGEFFFTQDYAIFSDDPNAYIPVYEMNVAENFADSKISEERAVKDSNSVLKKTGYPVVHKNYPWALDSEANPEKQVYENIPAFQIVHAYVIEFEPTKSSLASFILPPGWKQDPDKKYPIFFNSFYDLHGTSYPLYAVLYMNLIGELKNDGYGSTMGILWNGGGSAACYTESRSAYDNGALLFQTAEDLFGGDQQSIIMYGGSRGGMAALQMAANPYYNNYKARYVIAFAPGVIMGDHLLDHIDPTYPALPAGLDIYTGYNYAWKPDWIDPVTGLPSRLQLLENMYDTHIREEVNNLGSYSDLFISSLKERGTKINLAAGTNDHYMPIHLTVKYADKLRSFGVPLQFRIYYRFGHATPNKHATDELRNSMKSILQGEEIEMEEGTFFFRRKNEEDWNEPVEFQPDSIPIALEFPKGGGYNDQLSYVYIGGPGDIIELKVFKINDDEWLTNNEIVKLYEESFFYQYVQLPETRNQIETTFNHITLPSDESVSSGYYVYEAFYSRDNGVNWEQIPSEYIPQKSVQAKQPIFWFNKGVLPFLGSTFIVFSDEGRGWGLSTEMLE